MTDQHTPSNEQILREHSEVCEKCGSPKDYAQPIRDGWDVLVRHKCGTFISYGAHDRGITQSKDCRIAELETSHAAMQAVVSAAEEVCNAVDESSVLCPGTAIERVGRISDAMYALRAALAAVRATETGE